MSNTPTPKERNIAICAQFLKMSKNQALHWEELITSLGNFIPYYAQYSNLCLNFFDWELPLDNEQLNGDFIERLLFYKGRCAVINDKDKGLIVCDFRTVNGQSNIFGYPTKIQALDIFDYNKVIGDYESDNFVIIPNNKLWYPTNITVLKYAIDISNILDAINLNVESQKLPVILQSPDDKAKLSMEQIAEKIETGERYIFAKSDFNIQNAVQSLNISAPFIADRLQDLQQRKIAELLTAIGINNENVNKESGITADEVNSNNTLVKLNFDSMLIPRQEACDEIKRKFNINTWCDVKDFNTNGLYDMEGGAENVTV
jgi:hypothetical protein